MRSEGVADRQTPLSIVTRNGRVWTLLAPARSPAWRAVRGGAGRYHSIWRRVGRDTQVRHT
ncbi:hypothetical protein E2C01_050098 [Portunus trituberculatus]|uniref:Uncharacterized protein n=1 Tax=Portunus trituberculatus TaxID=210409 RepID=A0A5B7GFK6_PORTR|nr:hypothetical protein [Portunus trituberculatus]